MLAARRLGLQPLRAFGVVHAHTLLVGDVIHSGRHARDHILAIRRQLAGTLLAAQDLAELAVGFAYALGRSVDQDDGDARELLDVVRLFDVCFDQLDGRNGEDELDAGLHNGLDVHLARLDGTQILQPFHVGQKLHVLFRKPRTGGPHRLRLERHDEHLRKAGREIDACEVFRRGDGVLAAGIIGELTLAFEDGIARLAFATGKRRQRQCGNGRNGCGRTRLEESASRERAFSIVFRPHIAPLCMARGHLACRLLTP